MCKKETIAILLTVMLAGTSAAFVFGANVSAEEESSVEDSTDDESEDTSSADDEESDIEVFTSGDYGYTVDEDTGTATLTVYNGTSDTDLILPDTVDGVTVSKLGNAVLLNHTELETITNPDSVEDIGDSCFYGCTALEEIVVEDGNTALQAEDGVLYSADGLYLIYYPTAKADTSYSIADGVVQIMPSAFAQTCLTDVVFPDTLLYIDSWAFAYSSLETLNLPESLTEIGQYAFSYCTGLTEVTFPDSLELMEAACFAGCENLTEVTFSDAGNLATIQMAAFAGTGLTEVTIPSSVSEIGFCAFGYELDMDTTVSGFVVYGVTGSQAQTYCTDSDDENDYSNNFTFRTISSKNEVATDTTKTGMDYSESFLDKYGMWIFIGGVAVLVLIVGIILIVSGNRKGKTDKDKTNRQSWKKAEKAIDDTLKQKQKPDVEEVSDENNISGGDQQ